MKKGILLAGIIIWVAVLVVLSAVLLSFMQNRGDTTNFQAGLVKEESIPADGISGIVVKSDAIGIEVFSTSGTQVMVRQYGKANIDTEDLFTLDLSGDTVKISARHKFRLFDLGLNFAGEKLVIEIPAAWSGDVSVSSSSGGIKLQDGFAWQEVDLSCSSGSVAFMQQFQADNLRVNASSGGIHAFGALTVRECLSAGSTSGRINLQGPIKAASLYAKANSGGIALGETEVAEFSLSSSSGRVSVAGISGSGSVKVNSGGISIKLNEPLGQVDLQSSSGGIKITVDQALSFNFSASCSSGGIRADFPLDKNEQGNKATASVGGSPAASIAAKANSGSISISRE